MIQAVIHDVSCGLHQVIVHLVIAIHRDPRHLFRTRVLLLIKDGLQRGHSCIVLMVQGF